MFFLRPRSFFLFCLLVPFHIQAKSFLKRCAMGAVGLACASRAVCVAAAAHAGPDPCSANPDEHVAGSTSDMQLLPLRAALQLRDAQEQQIPGGSEGGERVTAPTASATVPGVHQEPPVAELDGTASKKNPEKSRSGEEDLLLKGARISDAVGERDRDVEVVRDDSGRGLPGKNNTSLHGGSRNQRGNGKGRNQLLRRQAPHVLPTQEQDDAVERSKFIEWWMP